MTKAELRALCLKSHMEDKWWIQIDDEICDEPITLDEAFQRAKGGENAYIIHAFYAEADEPHWMKMGKEEHHAGPWTDHQWVCARCHKTFNDPVHRCPRPGRSEALLYCLFILPGLIARWRRQRKNRDVCPFCYATRILRTSTRAGQSILER